MKRALAAAGFVLAGGVLAAPAGAATIYQNDFESGSLAGITGGAIQTAPNGQKFLGFLSGGSSASLNLSGLGSYSSINISFDLYVMNSMDGSQPSFGPDFFRLDLDATTLLNETFANNTGWVQTYGPNATDPGGTGSSASGTLGYSNGFGPDWTYSLSFNPSISSSTAVLAFLGNSTQAWSDEGFGIDNILVTAVATTPIPAALPLFASALGAMGWIARRQRKKATATA
jgi:hypothetical protein